MTNIIYLRPTSPKQAGNFDRTLLLSMEKFAEVAKAISDQLEMIGRYSDSASFFDSYCEAMSVAENFRRDLNRP